MVSAMAASRPDDVDVELCRLNYCFLPTLHDTLLSNHIYIGDGVALEDWTLLGKFRERSDLLPEVLLTLPDKITVTVRLQRPPNNQEDRSN